MSLFNAVKEVGELPVTLIPNTLYLVRVGEGFDLYCSDVTGAIAHKVNGSSEGGSISHALISAWG